MQISKEIIETEYKKALDDCFKQLPAIYWVIQPQSLSYIRDKRAYGKATEKGDVLISEYFIGTTAITKLRNTLRHELAHLAVGLDQNHNRVFKAMLARFGEVKETSKEDYEQITNNIDYKYTLTAVLENGENVEVGKVHRRTKKYKDYHLSHRRMSFKGTPVLRFEYAEN